MRKSKFTSEQIVQVLRQTNAGSVVIDICRKLGITEATLCRWKKTYTDATWASCASSGSYARRIGA